MYRSFISLLMFLIACCTSLDAQQIRSAKSYTASKKEYDNVKVIPVHTDNDVSSFIIFVKKGVKPHLHKEHTEQVLVLEGKGIMTVGTIQKKIQKGDLIIIPKGIVHSVKVTSRKPLKALSIQAPEFKGMDRIFVESH